MKRKLTFFTFVLAALFLLLIGLDWLALGVLLIGGVCIVLSAWKWIVWVRNNFLLSSITSLIGIVVSAILLRVFLFEIYGIPTESMEDSLFAGDELLVSKLNYGPRLPESPLDIPWINLYYYVNKTAMAKERVPKWSPTRLKGFSKVSRRDILVFITPGDTTGTFYIKRCVGLPGEYLQVRNGLVTIDGVETTPVGTVKRNYKIWTKDFRKLMHQMDSVNNRFYLSVRDKQQNYVEVLMSQKEKENLMSIATTIPSIDSVTLHTVPADTIPTVYPYDDRFRWSIDHFGPVRIPARGATIGLNWKSYALYKKILLLSEGVAITEKDEGYYLDGKQIWEYTFKRNYYFVIGDNWGASGDSRIWGFLPEQNIEGKAVCVLFSRNENGLNWKRVLKFL